MTVALAVAVAAVVAVLWIVATAFLAAGELTLAILSAGLSLTVLLFVVEKS